MHFCRRMAVIVLSIGMLASVSKSSFASDAEWVVGQSWTSAGRSTAATFGEWIGSEHRLSQNLTWQPAVGAGWIGGRDDGDPRLYNDVWVASVGARLPNVWKRLFVGFQIAGVTPHTDALCSTLQFVSTIGWQQGHLVVMIRHISNGSTKKPNLGETMLLAGVHF